MANPMDLNHLRTFQLVVASGSLAAAARTLGVPTSTVSRHISRLEETLGADLLHRGPRRIAVTEAGESILTRSRQPLRELLDLASDRPGTTPSGTLRIAAPSNVVLAPAFASMLVEFRRQHPNVEMDVDCSAWLSDLVDDGFDVGFRPYGTLRDRPDLMVRRLAPIELRLYAAPGYLQRAGRPASVDDLRRHDMVVPRFLRGRPLSLHRGKRLVEVEPRVVFVGDDLSFVLAMVQAGAGFAVIPAPEAKHRVDAGALAPVLPGWRLAPLQPAVVWLRRRFVAPRVRAFVNFVGRALG